MRLFGKPDRGELLTRMVSEARKQKYPLERQIRNLQRENDNVTKKIKKYAKDGSISEAKILAKELVNSRKTISRLYAATAQLDNVMNELKIQSATAKMTQCLQSSTSVMKSMSSLIKLPELNKTMKEMSKEMMKMGIIDEMIDDTMESAFGDVDSEDVSEEVDKILQELFTGEISKAPDACQDTLPAGTPVAGTSKTEIGEDESLDRAMGEMQERLAALRN